MFDLETDQVEAPRMLGIMFGTTCDKHLAIHGEPCWIIFPGTQVGPGFLSAVCGDRTKKAGYASAPAKKVRKKF